MNEAEKKEVMQKFKKKSERDVLKNTGIPINIGTKTIKIKELIWDDAERFEDKIIELSDMFNEFDGMTFKELDMKKIVETLVQKLLRQGLLDLAEIITEGTVTLDYIKENRATKSDIILLVTEGFVLNYGYVKNLMTLVTGLK